MLLLEELKRIIEANPYITQYHNIPLSDPRYRLLGQYYSQLDSIIKQNSFCFYQRYVQDPHAQGLGVVMIMTVSNDPKQLKEMYRQIIEEAKRSDHKWICISHRIAPYTYKHKYYFIWS